MGKRGRPRHPDVLTPREWEVLAFLREGLSNDAIAGRLGISLDGVKYHVSEILGKLGLDNRADAARWVGAAPAARRPWWAFAPLGILRPRWLSLPIALAIVIGAAAAIGVLVWALIATRGGEEVANGGVPVALPAADKLAYIGSDRNLWLLEGDGPARRLTENEDELSSYAPQWSPDGRYTLFQRATYYPPEVRSHPAPHVSLWIADTTTGDVQEVPFDFTPERPEIWAAQWSPQGDAIAFLSQTGFDHGNALWLADLDGNVRQVVPPDFGLGQFTPFAWSPDGTKIALARSLPVTYPDDINASGATVDIPEENGVYVLDLNARLGTRGNIDPVARVADLQRAWDEGEGRAPATGQPQALAVTGVDSVAWSPDGAFIAAQPATLSASLMADGVPLFTVPATGGEPAYHGTMLRSQALMDWFPDSHRFVFTLGSGRELYVYKCLALAEAGASGNDVLWDECSGQLGALTPVLSLRSDAHPDVSPDGSRIVFQASEPSSTVARLDVGKIEGPREGIWVADADGSNERQLTSDPDNLDFAPRWSADGELVLFVRTDGKQFGSDGTPEGEVRAELWMMRGDGSGARSLVTDAMRLGSYYGLFAWEQTVAWWQAR